MKPRFSKAALLLSALLVSEKLCADGPIVPVEAFVIGGLLAVVVGFIYLYVASAIVFSILNSFRSAQKKGLGNSIFLGLVFLILSILVTGCANLTNSWFIWLIVSFSGIVLGYFLAADKDAFSGERAREQAGNPLK
jgi:hypothetical protein